MNILEACLGEKWFVWIGSEFPPCLEKSVGENHGWSMEAASVFFVQLCLEWLSNEHTWSLSRCTWETIRVNCCWMSDLPRKICWRKICIVYYGWSTEAASVFFLQLCIEWLSNEHTWSLSWWETIWANCLWMSDLSWKVCWRKIRVINRSWICFLCPVMFRITLL